MKTNRKSTVSLAFGLIVLTNAGVQAQSMQSVWQSAAMLNRLSPEQSLNTQSHLITPAQRMRFRSELGLIHDKTSDHRRQIPTTLVTQQRDEKPQKRDAGRPAAKDGNLEILHKAIRTIEEKLHATDDRKDRAELQNKLEVTLNKLREVEAQRGHRDEHARREHAEHNHDDSEHHAEGHHDVHEHGDHGGRFHVEMEKIRALHEAAERLKHGGLHDMAHQLHRQAEEIEKAIDRSHRPAAEHLLMEIMQNMEQLRREVREVNERLDVITRRLDKGKD